MIPNLIVPGAAKSGTSSLHNYLNIHPEIVMAEKKEPHFFTVKERFDQGLDFYKEIFLEEYSSASTYYGESSTSYLPNHKAIVRIKETLPNVKFIIILRNPIKRSISHYKWAVTLGYENKRFIEAVNENVKVGTDYNVVNKGGIWKGYYTSSLYGKHIANIYAHFSRKNVLVITTEDLDQDPFNTLNNCFSFLGLEKLASIPEIRTNVTKDKHRFSSKVKRYSQKQNLSFSRNLNIIKKFISGNFKSSKRLKNSIHHDDEAKLKSYLAEDIEIFRSLHPEILEKWKL